MGLRGFGSRGLGYASVGIFVAWTEIVGREYCGLPPGKFALAPPVGFPRHGPFLSGASSKSARVCGIGLELGFRVNGMILTPRSKAATRAGRRAYVFVPGPPI